MADLKLFRFETKILKQALLEWRLDPRLPMDRVLRSCFEEHSAGSRERLWVREAAFIGVRYWTAIFGLKLDVSKSRELREFEKHIQVLLKSLGAKDASKTEGPDVEKASKRWQERHRKLKPKFEDSPIEHLRQVHQMPEQFMSSWNLQDASTATALHSYLHQSWDRPPLCIRVNRTKAKREDVIAELGGEARPSLYSSYGIIFDKPVHLMDSELYHQGAFEVQDESSQIAVEILKPVLGKRVLDLCAGAGGKTLHLAELLEGGGEVWAYDVDKSKLKELSRRAARQGLDNIRVIQSLPKKTERFDLVLLDVPCSSIGNLRRNPDRVQKYAAWKKSSVQNELILEGAQFVERGGCLAYATCTLLPAENHDKFSQMRTPLREKFCLMPGNLRSLMKQSFGEDVGGRFLTDVASSYGGQLTPKNETSESQLRDSCLQWSFSKKEQDGHLSGAINGDGFFLSLYNREV